MSAYEREHPDQPELDAGEIEEAADGRTASAAKARDARMVPPETLEDSQGHRVNGDAMSETQAAILLGITQPKLRTHRLAGRLNPDLLLTDADRFAYTGRGTVVWYRRSVVENVKSGDASLYLGA